MQTWTRFYKEISSQKGGAVAKWSKVLLQSQEKQKPKDSRFAPARAPLKKGNFNTKFLSMLELTDQISHMTFLDSAIGQF